MSNVKNGMVLIVSMIFTIVALGFSASAGEPVVIPLNTTYEPLSAGIANEVTPNFTLNVGIVDTGTGINTANVVADVSSISTAGNVLMDLNGSLAGVGNITYFNKTVKVDKIVRGIFTVKVTAYDSGVNSSTANLIVVAFMYPGVKVIGYNSSKNFPAHPSNVSMFYNNSPVEIIVNTIDRTHYTNVTANFFEADGSIPLEYNNSGVLLSDGNYSYRITHTLGIIPNQDARNVWINVTMSTAYGTATIPKIGSLVVVSNINPREHPGSDLGGSTTNFRDIPDYSAAHLVFEPYNGTNRVATLKFNEPINLTEYTTAMNLKNLGEMLRMSGKSMDLNATANALREFNKAATLSIYNLTAFSVNPAILQDLVVIVKSGETSGGAVINLSWDNSTYTLSFNVSHWTEYSWDGEPPSVYSAAVGYPAGQTAVRSGQSITLSAAIVDLFSGVKNATVNAASIGAGTVVLNNVSGNWMNSSVAVSASDGIYDLNITAYDNAGLLNNTAQIRVIVSNSLIVRKTIGVYDNAGTWALWNSTSNAADIVGFGFANTTPVVGDWDGDSKTDVGIYNKGGNNFLIRYPNGTFAVIGLGWGGVTPVIGDWNGDGKDKVGVYDNIGTWALWNTTTSSADIVGFGFANTTPVVGDWNGDDRTDVGIYNKGGNNFLIRYPNGTFAVIGLGWTGVTPVIGDWNGDGKKEVGVYDNAGTWALWNSTSNAADLVGFGFANTIPVVGDWNGDGKTDVGVYNKGGNNFLLKNASAASGIDTIGLGWGGVTPVVGRWS